MDEVKDIRDKAEAMAAYARQAKDNELIQYATEIKVRAERRCGELLARTEKNKGATVRGGMAVERHDRHTPTLADMGLTKDESSRYQQLAAMPAERFAAAVAAALQVRQELDQTHYVTGRHIPRGLHELPQRHGLTGNLEREPRIRVE